MGAKLRERLVVIGGDAAGMSAASQARRMQPDLKITVFERGFYTSYGACGLPYYVEGLIKEIEDLVARTPEVFRQKYDIDARVFHEVENIDLNRRAIRVRNIKENKTFWEEFDKLLIATGASPIRPKLPGIDAQGIFSLSILPDGLAIRQAVQEKSTHRAVIVGGGYVGLEMAEALLARGLEVSLVELLPQVMSTLDEDMAELIAHTLREMGVTLYLGEGVERFEASGNRVSGVKTSKRLLPADLVILGIGIRPNIALAKEAGIPLGETGAIAVDNHMRTHVPGVWAAGDCVECTHLVSGRKVFIALGTVANKQGRVAGINLGGGDAQFPGVVGTAIAKVGETEVARTGLSAREAETLRIDHVTAFVKARTRAKYYPGGGSAAVKVVAEKNTSRFLGGQIIGPPGAGKRIDIFATALHAGMKVPEMLYLDLAYAPPVSPVWDPVLIVLRQVAGKL
ncbi:MAG: flavoprotein oxidoreductase [candidate division Zixibacteria bacterium SM23_81]|nr:MAG: flavoprotein oxidoreductase [candidate division Zixibacteria bacterium SM23_81]